MITLLISHLIWKAQNAQQPSINHRAHTCSCTIKHFNQEIFFRVGMVQKQVKHLPICHRISRTFFFLYRILFCVCVLTAQHSRYASSIFYCLNITNVYWQKCHAVPQVHQSKRHSRKNKVLYNMTAFQTSKPRTLKVTSTLWIQKEVDNRWSAITRGRLMSTRCG